MKKLYATLLIGLILLYLLDAAFQIQGFKIDILSHNFVRFFSGFALMGIWLWFEHNLKLKIFLYIVLAMLVLDDILDFFLNIAIIDFEMFVYGLYVFCWGILSAYFFVTCLRQKMLSNQKRI